MLLLLLAAVVVLPRTDSCLLEGAESCDTVCWGSDELVPALHRQRRKSDDGVQQQYLCPKMFRVQTGELLLLCQKKSGG